MPVASVGVDAALVVGGKIHRQILRQFVAKFVATVPIEILAVRGRQVV